MRNSSKCGKNLWHIGATVCSTTKQKPKIIQYRKYKDFSNEAFMYELENALSRFSQISFKTFKSTVDNILQKHAPIKKRYVRANKASLMWMTRLRNKLIETDADRIAYNKQRNYCVSLIRKEKKRPITVILMYMT